jgi:hypothetical protein
MNAEVMRKPNWFMVGTLAVMSGFIVGVAVIEGHLSGIGGFALGVNASMIVHDLAFGRHP